ncbi:MAG: tetratricopeptide repeat protein [Oligoflexia bacterium]|nr:tetratricopeptide repeat protein [Oligoflexia bacterium]
MSHKLASRRIDLITLLLYGCSVNFLLMDNLPANAGDALEVKTLSPQAATHEQFDRDVDRAALSAQQSSIDKLLKLSRKYAGTRQEAVLLEKLADLQQQKAGILFRIAHGTAARKTKPGAAPHALDLAPYRKALDTSVATLSLLIAKYPNFEDIAHAYYTRGKAYEEMDKKPAAAKDYQYLVTHFPQAEETSPAYMSLADFAIDANNHPLAITYLKEIEKRPEDTHYPFALYKLAWSYYNLKNTPAALGYAEKQIAWYNDHAPAGKPADSSANVIGAGSDNALRENTLLDVPVFYFDAVEAKDDRYPASKALAYFRKLTSSSREHYDDGPILGKMSVRFAKLLRTRDMEPELIAWKSQFLNEEPKRPEGLDIITITYEFLQNRRDYAKLEAAAQDIVKIKKSGMKFENLGKAQKMILDTAEGLQSVIVQNKQNERAPQLSRTLVHMYDSFTQIVDEQDPRVPQVHYNLAETLFAVKDYDGATEHYRWVVDHLRTRNKEVLTSVADASTKAIAARYESLHQRNLVAQEIKAQPMPASSIGKKDRSKLDPMVATWIEWIDAEADKKHAGKSFDNFLFEANRSLYAHGDIPEAVERMEKFARTHPESEYAIPSASLVIDTALASKDWDRSLELSRSFAAIPAWKGSAFAKRLAEVAADCLYKRIEGNYAAAGKDPKPEKRYAEVLSDIDEFLKDYSTSERVSDALNLAGSAALAAGDRDRAIGYFGRLIKAAKGDSKNPGRLTDALLARAAIEEDEYIFVAAAVDYRSLIETNSAKKSDDLRKKTLALSYLSGDDKILKETLASKAICTESLADECEKYRVLGEIQRVWNLYSAHPEQDPSAILGDDETDKIFNRFRKMSSSDVKTLLAAYTLMGAKHLAFRDRNLTLRAVGSGYKDLDAMSKFVLMPLLSVAVPKTFDLNRIAMKDVAPLRADERYITHRVDMIREMENAATQSMELPWARIRSAVLNETASLYLDLAHGLEALPAPKGMNPAEQHSYEDTIRKLTVPFEEKGQDIRAKAFSIASGFAIEDDAFHAISEPFFAENPSQAKKLKADAQAVRPSAIYPSQLAFVRLGLDYAPYFEKNGNLKSNHGASALYSAWTRAIQSQKWAQVAFFLQRAHDKKLFSDAELLVLRGISLSQAGARGEGLAELEDARKNLAPDLKSLATLTLAREFEQAFAASKAKPFYSELLPPKR